MFFKRLVVSVVFNRSSLASSAVEDVSTLDALVVPFGLFAIELLSSWGGEADDDDFLREDLVGVAVPEEATEDEFFFVVADGAGF